MKPLKETTNGDIRSRSTFLIDLQSPIPGGVEILARAWSPLGEPIGFGKDGDVEIERFKIYNPPTYVPDPEGEFVETRTNPFTKQEEVRRFRYDPDEALRQAIEHTISVKNEAFTGSRIEPGKIGNTTSTFYPSSDGYVERNSAASTWASLQSGNGTANGTSDILCLFEAHTVSNQWSRLFRAFMKFDTSAIPDTDTISSATLSIYGYLKQDSTSNTPDSNIYSGPTTTLATTDYQNAGTTELATTISYGSWNAAGYNDYSLNASGIANISKTGSSGFSMRNANYDVANVAPTWASGIQTGYFARSSATGGTSNDPVLVVEHAAAGGATQNFSPSGGVAYTQGTTFY